ncbi:MBL fold metallo-hydrolase [Flammeovirga pectinis]|uniref:Linear primary-alkylsulfatase n=1 Tax=Flammeovirga pectinis TaxID=2494373 RepID=A0A3Q9FMS7_9BACT|nr:alkyl sulfatase dimerization domain-containing protein [Flammeovirga pectinis]AZQ63125.1 MBL fold metallo-hydrolase [Flammeovirga pectinis]
MNKVITLTLSMFCLINLTVVGQEKPKAPSQSTESNNKALYKKYPFDDKTSFEEAKKGFIAPLPNNGVVKDANGRVVWDLSAFKAFIKEDKKSPSSVNPSLWRQSQLLMISGLFEVVPGVYQVRGADLSNMTIVEADGGLHIYDPLISKETAKYALDLYYQNRPKVPVKAVFFSHSHVDHFGGVVGVASPEDVASGKIKIYAPEGFLDHAIEENVYAGVAMSRRSSYMYGNVLPPDAKGQIGAGLGVTTSSGTPGIYAPTNSIKETGEKHTIDGIEYQFVMAPGSEAPSEMMWYLPKYKMLNTAEDAVHTMHNLYTLRGAKTRDASKWPTYLNQVLQSFGDTEVAIGMHHWPVWGKKRVVDHIKSQRDTYKYMHDQTLHHANMGATMNELPGLITMPESLVNQWGTHGYYGSLSHNVRAVYNFYLGYFDGNPANLNPLPPVDVSKKYVKLMGGADKVMAAGKLAFDNGEYRWAAELLNHLIFAEPNLQDAKNLQADVLEQMGYQTENGPWRNFYLAGAFELRNGVKKASTPKTSSPQIISNMSMELIFGYMGIQLDVKKAAGKKITLNWVFTDVDEKYTLFLENSVLNYWPNSEVKNPDATITMERSTLNDFLLGKITMKKAIESGKIKIKGDAKQFITVLECLDDLNKYFYFNIVTP